MITNFAVMTEDFTTSEDAPERSDEEARDGVGGIVGEVTRDAVAAIGAEIAASLNDSASTIELTDGRFVGTIGPMNLWSFTGSETLPVPAETPATIQIPGQEPLEVTVLAVDDQDYVIGIIDEVGEQIGRARLSLDPWFIYDKLRDRLEAFDASASGIPLVETLLDIDDAADVEPPIPSPPDATELSAEQRSVAGQAGLDGVRFVWGPPGTGKTATLAATIRMLVLQGKRVCVLAHANAAVDVAMLRVARQLHDHPFLTAGRILRVGVPHLGEVREHPYLNPDEVLRHRQPALIAERDELVLARKSLARRLGRAASPAERQTLADELEAVRGALSQLETRITEARNELIDGAVVIGLTLSRLVISELAWDWDSDVVIIDEASMAALPFVLAVALRGAQTLAFFGDFRQLPPIATSKSDTAQQWFARDVFELAGVRSRVESGVRDHRLSILRTQFRMGSSIASVVGKFAYFDLLRTDVGADERARELSALAPEPGTQIVVVDTTELLTSCLRDVDQHSFSRFNLSTAALSASVARSLAAQSDGTVGVISAYRAQARIITELLRGHDQISSATTHKFQGSERDAIVLDLVDAAPQAGPSMLTGSDVDLSLRLLNVAVSRARGKLIILADLSFIDDHHPLSSPARQLLELARGHGASVVAAAQLIATQADHWRADWFNAVDQLCDGGFEGSSRLRLNVPSDDFGGPWLESLCEMANEEVEVIVHAPVTVASTVEHAAVDLKLKTLGPAPMIFLDGPDTESNFLVGGTSPDRPVAELNGVAVMSVVRRFLIGEAGR